MEIGYRIVCAEHNGHYVYIENQATGKTRFCNVKDIVHELPVELWNVDRKVWQSWKIYESFRKSPHYPPNHRLR